MADNDKGQALTLADALDAEFRDRLEYDEDEDLSSREERLIRAVVGFDKETTDVDPAEAVRYVIGFLQGALERLDPTEAPA